MQRTCPNCKVLLTSKAASRKDLSPAQALLLLHAAHELARLVDHFLQAGMHTCESAAVAHKGTVGNQWPSDGRQRHAKQHVGERCSTCTASSDMLPPKLVGVRDIQSPSALPAAPQSP